MKVNFDIVISNFPSCIASSQSEVNTYLKRREFQEDMRRIFLRAVERNIDGLINSEKFLDEISIPKEQSNLFLTIGLSIEKK